MQSRLRPMLAMIFITLGLGSVVLAQEDDAALEADVLSDLDDAALLTESDPRDASDDAVAATDPASALGRPLSEEEASLMMPSADGELPQDAVYLGLAVKPGSTFGGMMASWDLPDRPIHQAALPLHDLAKIRPDRELQILLRDGSVRPVAVRYALDEDRILLVEQQGDAWLARIDEVTWRAEVATRHLVITHSLWLAGIEAGLRPDDLLTLAKIFEYELDFNTELQPGARIDLAANVLSAPGRKPKLGEVFAARLINGGEPIVAVMHRVDDEVQWFRPDGKGMSKPFLRSPLEFSRVTSGFNPRRFHPILKVPRPHQGTDFGAPTGTPVRSVADGVVVYAGRNGGHGNFVKVRHDEIYTTSYSHLSRIQVRKGQRVRQGQTVGRVGATGLATGPHLHYQMWQRGRLVDAMKVKLPTAATLPAADKGAFTESVARWVPMLDAPAD